MMKAMQRIAVVLSLLGSGLAQAAYVPPAPALDDNAYLVMDDSSGAILAAKNPDTRLGPASLTKLMTSYIVERALIEGRLHEGDQVPVSATAWRHGSNEESTMFLPVHGQARVIDLLRGIIIVSANDACTAIAEYMAGTETAFADIMNHTAATLGLHNTHYMNASGLPDAQHYSSARDLAILAHHIIHDNSSYYGIYAEREFSWQGHTQGNRNALLYTDPSVDGLKTGHTEASGYSLVASAHRQGMRLIVVVLGAKSMQERADQPRALLNWAFSAYESVTPYHRGDTLTQAHVWFGQRDSVALGLDHDLALVLPRGAQSRLKASLELTPRLQAPLHVGQVAGKVVCSVDGQVVGEQPLVVMQDDGQAGFFKRLWQHLLILLARIF